MDAIQIMKSLGMGLSRALRYLFPGVLLMVAFALVDPCHAIRLYYSVGWQLFVLVAVVLGIGLYAIHRRLIIPFHHLCGCIFLSIGDFFCHVEPENSLSPTRWFGSLYPPVPRFRRMLAYSDIRRWWFNSAEERDDVNLQHAENGLPVMISEAIIVIALYPRSWIIQFVDQGWLLGVGIVLFLLSAIAGMQEHRTECAHFKTDIPRAQHILRKFTEREHGA